MMANLPPDYAERVYAGVLGKIIGVYLGRPFEGWPYRQILERLGEVDYYVNDQLKAPLVVTDDDISGTFTFLRALADYDADPGLMSRQIGETWLNYIIENRTILWWGGMGLSTEHTAYLRMKRGTMPPESGSASFNGQVVAEQIGSQIFIDGWGLICPGDPAGAADFARRASEVSHDGEAIYGAQVVAALVAGAFTESNIDRLIDGALAQIPNGCLIATMIGDIRGWHREGRDWKAGFERIEANYGYDKYGGNCHIVPNHAIVIHALIHGAGDFGRSLMIANTCGWDTDCNSGNVGCIVAVMGGLPCLDTGRDWRGPVADRLFLPTADGGRCVTDAVQEADEIVRLAHRLHGLESWAPKEGARFHFSYPGSTQGFTAIDGEVRNEGGRLWLEPSAAFGYAVTGTFPSAEERKMGGYSLIACPTLYPGQLIEATLWAGDQPAEASIIVQVDGADDEVHMICGPSVHLTAGESKRLTWQVPDVGGYPIASVGIRSDRPVAIDRLTWSGEPNVTLRRTPSGSGWRDAWVNGVSEVNTWGEPFRLMQNEGTGLYIQGSREWRDIGIETMLVPHMAESAGVAVRVQGMRRYYSLVLCRDGMVRLIKALEGSAVLAEAPFAWVFGESHRLRLEVNGNRLIGWVDDAELVSATDNDRPLTGGAIALVIEEGRMATHEVRVYPT